MIFLFGSCEKDGTQYQQGDLEVVIEVGEEWLHEFPVILGISKKNPPQFAIWLEDTSGTYLSTVFVSEKIATEGWQANQGNRRKEALPHWCYQRGVVYEDGLLLPSKENPVPDAISGATPKEDASFLFGVSDYCGALIVKAEFNHSVDFNDFFPADAKEGDENYSGGEEGSGQPAVVYSALLNQDINSIELEIIGHSYPDGSCGEICTDLSKLTSVLSIVKTIQIHGK